MRKKLIGFFIMISIIVSVNSNYAAFAAAQEPMSLNTMLEILIRESVEAQNIEINTELLLLQNEKKIEDYNDFKEKTMKEAEGELNLSWADLQSSLEQISKSGNDALQSVAATKTQSYIYSKNIYKSRVEGYVGQMKSIEPIILQIEQSDRQKNAEIEKLKTSFTKEYYDLYIAEKDLELTKQDMILLQKQYEAEIIKQQNGMATNISVDELQKQLRDIKVSIEEKQNNIELMKERMKTKLGMGIDEELVISYQIPQNPQMYNYSLLAAMNAFESSSIELERAKQGESISENVVSSYTLAYTPNLDIEVGAAAMTKEEENKIKAAELELKKAQNTYKSTKHDMELYVKKAYYDYRKARLYMLHGIENQTLIKQKQEVTKAKYQQGQISQLQYEAEMQDSLKRLFDVEKASINYELAQANMEMILKGIWVK